MLKSTRTKLVLLAAIALAAPSAALADTKVVKTPTGFQLQVDGKPFLVKGVGGATELELAQSVGVNSFRTWGTEDLGAKLDAAQKLGMKVAVGIWLGHERHGFDYNNVDKVAEQYEKARADIEKYKSHPAILMWVIGNEMEGFKDGDNAAIWSAVNNLAALAKKLDPARPTMTVISEVGGARVSSIHKLCPDIDIVGINTYAGAASIADRYVKAGGTKPFIITEFGPPGTWEVEKNNFGALNEPTSTAKAESYRAAATAFAASPLHLGSYAFKWGHKQEATATWFGMLLPDGTRLAAVDTMQEIWSGKPPANRVPTIQPITFSGPALIGADRAKTGETITATLVTADPEKDPLTITWELHKEPDEVKLGGDAEAIPPQFPNNILNSQITPTGATVDIKLPETAGTYRLFAFVRDNKRGGAIASIPVLAVGPKPAPAANAAPAAKLPVVVYADDVVPNWHPSGWMGNHGAIKVDPAYTVNPRSGLVSFKVDYLAPDGFAGIAWQYPPNDWGDLPAAFNATGAKKLSFWARGDKGGEKVEFKFGILDKSKKFPDSASGGIQVTLTPEWKQYSIDVEGLDLSTIKTGFVWSLAGQGKPLTFFLDDIKFE